MKATFCCQSFKFILRFDYKMPNDNGEIPVCQFMFYFSRIQFVRFAFFINFRWKFIQFFPDAAFVPTANEKMITMLHKKVLKLQFGRFYFLDRKSVV